KLPLKRKALLVVVLASAILSYGGVNLFVIVFSIYPIALVLFKEENIPKRLFPAALFLGSATFTMVAMPGTPAIQNLIPAETFGTTAYAAPTMGIIASAAMLGLGIWWLYWSQSRLAKKQVGFVPGPRDDMDNIDIDNSEGVPSFWLSILPIIIVLGLIFILNYYLLTVVVVNIALASGVLSTTSLFWPTLKVDYVGLLNAGGHDVLTALMSTAVVVGFGGVVAMSSGFDSIVDWTMGLN